MGYPDNNSTTLFLSSSVSLCLFLFHSLSQLTEAGSELCWGEKVAWWAQPATAGLSSCIGKWRGRRAGSDLGRCFSCAFGMATDTPRPLFITALIRRLDSGVSSALFDAFHSDSTYHMNSISACTLLPCSLLQLLLKSWM